MVCVAGSGTRELGSVLTAKPACIHFTNRSERSDHGSSCEGCPPRGPSVTDHSSSLKHAAETPGCFHLPQQCFPVSSGGDGPLWFYGKHLTTVKILL